MGTMRKIIRIVEGSEQSQKTEMGTITLPITLTRKVDPHAYKSAGRAGIQPCVRISGVLRLGEIIIGGYEMVEGTSKVTVNKNGMKYSVVSSENEATDLLMTFIK